MARAATKPEARSPYQKYGKSPYKYESLNCRHSRSVEQSTPDWRGAACATCNNITATYSTTAERRRFEAV
ncbi:hypothetical protein [uncultured Bradyrhizobium sp.]|uniref:hypothetical protein n=1 Tax=uncultured Bradyrhizobium sp. TaxID=199684 RepID=UPI0035C95929